MPPVAGSVRATVVGDDGAVYNRDVKVLLCTVAIVACSCAATGERRASNASPSAVDEWGRPEIVLTTSGWVGLPNTLVFALYASGRVLYPADVRYGYVFTTLTAAERNALIGDLPLDRVGHVQLPEREGSDGATECIKVASPHGIESDCLWGGFEASDAGALPPAPRELEMIWKRLAHFRSPRATPWTPDHVDVRAEPWGWRQPEQKCGKPVAIRWPKRWPQPGGNGLAMPTWGWSFSLPPSELPELMQIQAATRPNGCRQAVALGGESYALSFGVRLPHEDAWWRN